MRMVQPRRVGITGVGAALPDRELATPELQRQICAASGFALPRDLLESVTGIRHRRVASDAEYASTLAIAAGQAALSDGQCAASEVDLLVFASATRDMAEPATAHVVQAELGTHAHCFDLANACNSFLNGVDVARSMILAGRARRALVVTGETPTRAMRYRLEDASQARSASAGFTFGDAGAAVVLGPVARGGILDVDTETRSEHWAVAGIPGGGSRHPRGDEHTYFTGDGRALRRVFELLGPAILKRVWWRTSSGWDDVRRVLVHQVTLPYLERFLEVTGVPGEKLEVTVTELGNVASATLGVQLDRVAATLEPGDRVLFIGMGGGISVTTVLWEVS